jgi:hypothetical protein
MLGIKALMAAELDQLSDGHNDENSRAASGADDDSANLDQFDEAPKPADPEAVADESEATGDTVPEGEEAPAVDDAAATDDPPAQPPAAPPEAEANKQKHEGFQSRIDELTARAKGAEEKLAAYQEQLAAYRARDEGALTPDVLDHVESPEDLAKTQQRYSALMNWAIRNPDGGKLGDRDYSPEEVRALHAEVQTLVTEAVPARRAYLEKRAQADGEAVNFYPWLKDTTKGAGNYVQKAIEQIPALRKLPNYRMLAADAFVGQVFRGNGIRVTDDLLKRLVAEQQRTPAKGQPTANAKPPGSAPRPAPQPPAAPGRAGVLPPRSTPRAAAAKAGAEDPR